MFMLVEQLDLFTRMEPMSKMVIICDTREKQPFWSEKSYKDFEVIRQKLDTGDYSLQDHEHEICVERKKGASELYNNFTSGKKRFFAEVDRMQSISYKYIVIEATHEELMNPLSYRFLRRATIAPKIIMGNLLALSLLHNIHIIYAGNAGRSYTKKIFEKFLEYKKKGLLS